ncbi:asparaginase [Mycobacterium sp. SMC-4]|uniref:asparaginase n=1 Tax=Mycobacterium sp. SMC-4 TaxID=2857059 RepID=UPI003D06E97A
MSSRPLVVVLATGGTISSRRRGSGEVVATDEARGLAGDIDWGGTDVKFRDVMTIGSYQLRLSDMGRIVDAVADELARPEVTGVVVTHGTDTLEETAMLLDLVHADDRPVVFTGAQRPADCTDGDGRRNLRDAVSVAADPHARGLGVLVSFGGDIFPARGVRKIHTTDLAAFGHPDGRLGSVVDGRPRISRSPLRPKPLTWTGNVDARVDMVLVYPGAETDLLTSAATAGARGIVLVGTGIGNAPAGFSQAVAELTGQGVVVALSSRVQAGPVLGVYGNGGGADLISAGAVAVSDLPASQARILLATLLSAHPDASPADVRTQFAELI